MVNAPIPLLYESGALAEKEVSDVRPNVEVEVPCQLVPFHARRLPRAALVVVPVPPFATPTVPNESVPVLKESGPETVTAACCLDPFVYKSEFAVTPLLMTLATVTVPVVVSAPTTVEELFAIKPLVSVCKLLHVLVVVVPKPSEKIPVPELYASG